VSSSSPRVYAGVDAAGRLAERRVRLLEAGLDLLGTGGLAATTVRKVCERAQLGARYFYESFDSLDALTVAVFDEIVAQMIEAGERALAAARPGTRSQLRAALGSIIDLIADDPRKGHVVLTLALGSPALARRRLSTAQLLADNVAHHVRRHFGPAAPADRQLSLITRFLVGGFAETLTAWMHSPGDISRGQLLDECTELFLATISAAAALTPQL
jgi:AcrR family transcriptional regulator